MQALESLYGVEPSVGDGRVAFGCARKGDIEVTVVSVALTTDNESGA